jgi:serine/threonine protein kinase
MNDTTHPSPDQLAAFDAGRLSPTEQTLVEEHVSGCAACCRKLEGVPEDPFAALVRAFGGRCRATPTSAEPGPDTLFDLNVPAPLIGHSRYRVLECIGAGGMGAVYKAVHLRMGRLVALKVLHARFTTQPAFVERFRREVQAAARLSHANIVTAHDADQAGDLHFLVMEYVPGTPLDRLVAARGPLPLREACDYARQAALGLQHAFEQGTVHRDVKPSNLMLTSTGQVKVLDFGLALLAGDTDPGGEISAPILGTPDYVAPEQARCPSGADTRADVYGLGCTLYFLLTGEPPFPGPTALQKLLAHQDRTPPRVTARRPDVPAELEAILERMLAKDPARRYSTPLDVARELGRFADPSDATVPERPPELDASLPGRRRVLVVGGLCAAVLAALLVWLVTRNRGSQDEDPGGTSPSELPARTERGLVTPELANLRKKERRDQAITWLQTHNRWGRDSRLVMDTVENLDTNLDRIDGFQLNVGSRLLKSQKTAILVGHPGGFFEFQPDDDQVRALGLKESSRVFLPYRKGTELRRATPTVRLFNLRIDNADLLGSNQKVTGSVSYQVDGKREKDYVLRLTFYPERGRHTGMCYLNRPLDAGTGSLSFTFPPLGPFRYKPPGLLVVFVELSSEEGGKTIIESNTTPALVRVAN